MKQLAKLPRFLEVMKLLLEAFDIDTQDIKKTYSRFVQGEYLSLEKKQYLRNELYGNLFLFFRDKFKLSHEETTSLQNKYIYHIESAYLGIRHNVTVTSASQKQVYWHLIISFFIPYIALHYNFLKTSQNKSFFKKVIEMARQSYKKINLKIRNNTITKELKINFDYKLLEKNDFFLPVENSIPPLKIAIDYIVRQSGASSISDFVKSNVAELHQETTIRNLNRWINGQALPSMGSLKNLVQEKKEHNFKILAFARALQYIISKSNNYFGKEKTVELIDYFKNVLKYYNKHDKTFYQLPEDYQASIHIRLKNITSKEQYLPISAHLISYTEELPIDSLFPKNKTNKKPAKNFNKLLNTLIEKSKSDYFELTKTEIIEIEQQIESVSGKDEKNNLQYFLLMCLVSNKRPKNHNDEQIIKEYINIVAQKSCNINMPYSLDLIKAFFNIQLYQYEDALENLKKALNDSIGRNAELGGVIITFGCILAAYLSGNSRSKSGSFYGIKDFNFFYETGIDEVYISRSAKAGKDLEIQNYKKKIHWLFSPEHYFKSVTEEDIQKIKQERFDTFFINTEKLQNFEYNFNNPAKRYKGFGPVPFSQLMIAALFRDCKNISSLLEKGANPNEVCQNNYTPLTVALDPTLLNKLPDIGLDKILQELQSNISGNKINFDTTPVESIMYVLNQTIESSIQAAKLLLEQNVQPIINKTTETEKNTPLMLAVIAGSPELVDEMLKTGADIDQIATIHKLTPLQMAIRCYFSGNYYLMSFLLSLIGPRLWRQNNLPFFPHITDLQISKVQQELLNNMSDANSQKTLTSLYNKIKKNKKKEYQKIIDILLKHNANTNTITGEGVTTLMLAIAGKDKNLVQKLLHAGADPCQPGENGENACDFADHFGAKKIEQIMKNHKKCNY